MTYQFARINLVKTTYQDIIPWKIMNPVPLDDVIRVYKEYCRHKNFQSVMPMVAGRFLVPGTEVIGYYDNSQLIAWSMYRIWDNESIVTDHHAWNYKNPKLRLGIRSLENECAIYRNRGFKYMYIESIQNYMFKLEGLELLGPIK